MTPAVLLTGEVSGDGIGDLEALCHKAGAELFTAAALTAVRRSTASPAPRHEEHPECTCAACRVRTAWITATGDDHLLVLVGRDADDIVSARCADLVLAGGALRSACARENITFLPCASLQEAVARLTPLVDGARLRKRWTAEQHRRALFAAEA
jgi:hypothetical protein